MAESKVNRDNYIVVQGWMISELGLKGNELLIYACIHGFSQAENQVFNGGLQYLADWTKSTKQGVSKSLKSLVEKGLIVKNDTYINGVKFCEYHATKLNTPLNSVEYPIKQSLTGGVKQSLTNNKDLDIKSKAIKDIIDYLNAKLGTKYSYRTKKTQEAINARFNEIPHLTVEDFYRVIDKKYAEWHGDAKMEQYLRPETLFGTKFEGYLNSKAVVKKSGGRKEIVPDWMERDNNKEIENMKRMYAAMTAGNNPEIAAKAEALKRELLGG